MTMSPRTLEKSAAAPRDKAFWGIILTLMVAQLVAFWMVCSHQVRKAEVRDVGLQVQRLAVLDCMRDSLKATLNSCTNRAAPQRASAVAVSYTVR
jgi:hypothetical protein